MTGFTDPDSPEYQPPLEDYWDKPRAITARQLATALMDVDLTRVESRETMYLDLAAAIIAAIPETAEPEPTGPIVSAAPTTMTSWRSGVTAKSATPMTEDPYADLARKAREATRGPWRTVDWDFKGRMHHAVSREYNGETVLEYPAYAETDAAYIASASPDVILALLEERRVLREALTDIWETTGGDAHLRAKARAALSGAAQEQGETGRG